MAGVQRLAMEEAGEMLLSISGIADKRMADRLHVHANLMSAASFKLAADQAHPMAVDRAVGKPFKMRDCWLGRRIFLRAPLHHSMQHKGLAETKVVIRLWIAAGILALTALATLKLR